MMASLHARLIAGLLVLAALGLLLLGGITYAEQRSFLYDRVDQQARDAAPLVGRVFEERAAGRSGLATPRGPDGDHGPGGGGGPLNLPQGTYAERREASGNVTDRFVLGLGTQAAPKVPSDLQPGDPPRTVGSTGSGLQYRMVASRAPDGDITVVAVPLREATTTLHRLLLVEALVIGGVLLVLGLGAFLVVRLGLRPLDRMGRTAGAIAAGDLSRRVTPATEKTEVGRLGLALNGMLGRLEEAFAEREASEDRLRRFLADASHELRTPLSSIRGYAELFRIGAVTDPEDLDKAMRRIEEEASRMGVLVEDLLTLARLDEVREAVREPVDLGRVAADAVDDARATAPDRVIDLAVDPPADVLGDRDQLRQVLANLMRNALVHTPPGTPVEVRVGAGDGRVRVEVRDHGQGLPSGDPQELFGRLWRAEGGRERGPAGAGLGLAIVQAIVHAHDGEVGAADAPGGGASFVVELPAAVPSPAVPGA
jgi:two-component system OmpR family sensor kinase